MEQVFMDMNTDVLTLRGSAVFSDIEQMQGDLSASIDQIAWVLTFNIVATAIATPPTGWLAARLGRKRLLLGAITGFSISTVLCGLSTSLVELIVWRTCQGLFGAPLVPLSQAITLDTFPKEQHGTATALWGMGVMLGPIVGSTVKFNNNVQNDQFPTITIVPGQGPSFASTSASCFPAGP